MDTVMEDVSNGSPPTGNAQSAPLSYPPMTHVGPSAEFGGADTVRSVVETIILTERPELELSAPHNPQHAIDLPSLPDTASNTTIPVSTSNKPAKQAPKSKARAAQRSPSPPVLPPPPLPALTVRLDIPLGGPSAYQVNILELARATGQRHPTPPPQHHDSDSSEDDEPEPEQKESSAPALKKRRKKEPDYYDLDDPFIDDTDLGVDAPTHFAQTKQKGFYVNSGDVTLVSDVTEPSKPKPRKKRASLPFLKPRFIGTKPKAPMRASLSALSSSRLSTPQPDALLIPSIATPTHDVNTSHTFSPPTTQHVELAGPSRRASAADVVSHPPPSEGEGTRESPIALLDDADTPGPNDIANGRGEVLSEKHRILREETIKANRAAVEETMHNSWDPNRHDSKKRKRSATEEDMPMFSPELQADLDHLRTLVKQESFAVKSKFPVNLRGPLEQVAFHAIQLGEYGDDFYRTLPEIFPYNKFTLTKLVRRLVYPRHKELLESRQNILLDELGKLTEEGFEHATQLHAEEVAKWEERQDKKKQAVTETETMTDGNPTPADGPSPQSGDADDNTIAVLPAEPGSTTPAAASGGGRREKKDEHPPQRYRWTNEIKSVCWEVVQLSNELALMQNHMHEYEPANHAAVSEQGERKRLYQRMVAKFPEGWMTTTTISREISNLKKKVQTAAEQDEEED